MNLIRLSLRSRRALLNRRLYTTNDRTHPALVPDPPASNPSLASDPYPIPLQSPDHASTPVSLAQRAHPQLPPKEAGHPEGRHNEPVDVLRARLVYCSRKRGIVENELLLSTFVEGGQLNQWPEEDLREYDRMLTLPDWDIYYYAIGRRDPPPGSEWADSKILAKLKVHAANKGRHVRKMPQLAPDTGRA